MQYLIKGLFKFLTISHFSFKEKEIGLGKKCMYGMFILSFKKFYQKNSIKKLYLLEKSINSRPDFFR